MGGWEDGEEQITSYSYSYSYLLLITYSYLLLITMRYRAPLTLTLLITFLPFLEFFASDRGLTEM